ncbi:hypothetical protein N8T08_003840 [Aspergillus melleus]|uniref:Uncharacterized protein n=1 Tax=Aspergillus melleus TaxID=138277 RepID=A0ACC3B5Y9_9EURO|nr:hypothetical protein N8T08_003840 [Aspergillus melleus]
MGLRTRIENAVEHTGLRQVAQYIRLVDWLKESDDATISSTEWAMNVMQIEYSIREIVQQETNVSKKCQRLYQEINAQGGVASSKQTQQLKDWEKELSVLNRENRSGICILDFVLTAPDVEAVVDETVDVARNREALFGPINMDIVPRNVVAASNITLPDGSSSRTVEKKPSQLYAVLGPNRQSKMAFAVNNGVSVVTALIGMTLFDIFGRRELTFHGCWIQAVFICLIGGLGSKTNRSTRDTNGMVASFILYAAVLHATLGPAAYITAAEIGTATLREKTMAISTAFNVVVGFVVVYTTPYLLSTPGAKLGAKLGYVWGGFAGAGPICVWYFMPELKGRNLEEIDQLFRAKLPAWRFKGYRL